MPLRPLIFLDVDGPLKPFREANLDPANGPRLLALDATLIWATTWMHTANQVIAPQFGLPELPVVAFPDNDRPPAAGLHWKTIPLIDWAAGRPFAWLDDELTDRDRHWVADYHPGPALLHHVDPYTGLTSADITVVADWLAGLSRAT